MGIEELNYKYSLEEFLEYEKTSEYPLEFVNFSIYAKSFTSVTHNTIVNRINARIDSFLFKKPCRVFSEQIEVILGKDRVKPDVFVVCKDKDDKFNMRGQSFLTIPSLVFEVVSPSNASLDTVEKMSLYARFGIKEYNLVYQEGMVHQYVLNEFGSYYAKNSYKINDIYKSLALEGLEIDLNRVFEDLEL